MMMSKSIHTRMRHEMGDKKLFEQAKTYAFDYMDTIAARTVYPDTRAIANLARFDEPMPDNPQAGEDVLHLLHAYGSPATVAQTGGRYFGFVNGNVIPTALAARWLSDTWDQNPALYVISPIVAKLEQICEQWLTDLFGLPLDSAAGFVSGTSIATMCGLAAARHTLLKRLDWDVNTRGLFGAPPFRVVVSRQAHGTVFKALALLGLGKDRVELVPADAQGRMKADKLPTLDANTLLILQAGNVNTGAFDPFDVICEEARQAGAWVHVDGAFGLWAATCEKRQYLTRGIEKADSWSVDGHKTLNTPYDCGIILCRHREALIEAMQASGAYIQYSDQRDGMLYGPDMSRRARAVEVWAALKYLGRKGVAQLIDGFCENAASFAVALKERGFRVLNDVVFNQVLVACQTPTETQRTLENIQRGGVCWCGGTVWEDRPAIRISVCSWATTSDDVAASIEAFVRARKKVVENLQPL
jgi:glutamate/tyrosine decarboxylase-like PLP-dependent enzyme